VSDGGQGECDAEAQQRGSLEGCAQVDDRVPPFLEPACRGRHPAGLGCLDEGLLIGSDTRLNRISQTSSRSSAIPAATPAAGRPERNAVSVAAAPATTLTMPGTGMRALP
jgi:hypothetical protein